MKKNHERIEDADQLTWPQFLDHVNSLEPQQSYDILHAIRTFLFSLSGANLENDSERLRVVYNYGMLIRVLDDYFPATTQDVLKAIENYLGFTVNFQKRGEQWELVGEGASRMANIASSIEAECNDAHQKLSSVSANKSSTSLNKDIVSKLRRLLGI